MPVNSSKTSRADALMARAVDGACLERDDALFLYTSPEISLAALAEAAREMRRKSKGATITYSPKVFLPLTNLCRDRCRYCTFRRDPGDAGAHWMEPDEVLAIARAGEKLGCKEALLSLGDRPEAAFPEARQWLRERGYERTLGYVAATSELLLRETSLLPHTNPGLMSRADLARLKRWNASLGLMLESTSTKLFEPGGAHEDAIDKRPERRLRVMREAGELKIPFTTGILVGIGESAEEVIDSLLVIRDLHQRYGHIQEVIVQNFVPKPEIPMHATPAPSPELFARTVAIARLALGGKMNIQTPPNLSPNGIGLLLDCGINDWGGLSPVTVDYINPEKPWPQVESLRALCEAKNLCLRERLTVYPEFVGRPEFFSSEILEMINNSADDDGFPVKRNVYIPKNEIDSVLTT